MTAKHYLFTVIAVIAINMGVNLMVKCDYLGATIAFCASIIAVCYAIKD